MGAPIKHESLFTDMDRAKELVDSKAAELDSRVLQPASNAFKKVSAEYPLATLFFTVFAILSFFPILAFIGFTICAGSIILATTLAFLIGWLTVVIGFAALILASVLAFTIGISLTVTGGAAAGLVAYRLFHHVKQTGSITQGVKLSISEIKAYVASSTKSTAQNNYPPSKISHRKHYSGTINGEGYYVSEIYVKPEVSD